MASGGTSVGSVSAELILETERFEDQLARAQAGLARTAQALNRLDDDLRAGRVAWADYAAIQGKLLADQGVYAQAIRETTVELGRLATATGGASTATMELDENMNRTSGGLVRLSRGFQSLAMGGPMQALRSIPRIFGGIAQTAGLPIPVVNQLTAGIGFLTTAGYLLYENWGALKAAIGAAGPVIEDVDDKIKHLETHLKELHDKPHKISIDYHEIEDAERALERLKSGKDEFEAGRKAKTDAQEQRGKILKDAVENDAGGSDTMSGAENLARFLTDAHRENQAAGTKDNLTPEDTRSSKLKQLDAWLAYRDAMHPDAGKTPEEVAELRKKVLATGLGASRLTTAEGPSDIDELAGVDEVRQEAEQLRATEKKDQRSGFDNFVGRFMGGRSEAERAQVEAEVERHPDLAAQAGLGGRFRRALRLSAPENITTPEEREEGEKRKEREKNTARDDAEKKRVRDKLIDDLNRQGAERDKEIRGEHPELFESPAARRKREVEARAKGFEAREGGEAALRGDLDRKTVKAKLVESGDTEPEAERLADDVLAAVLEHVDQKVRERALGEGIGRVEARNELIEEAEDKRAQKAQAAKNREEAAGARAEREGREKFPGVGRIAEAQIRQRRLSGKDPAVTIEEAAKQIAATLKERGMVAKEADVAAHRIAEDANEKVQEGAVKDVLEGDKAREAPRNSMEIAAADMNRAIQESISGDAGDKQLKEMQEMRKLMEANLLVSQKFLGKKFNAVLG